jgi:enamine deaminase RidA (YjgF/YER057c/UK114 family)
LPQGIQGARYYGPVERQLVPAVSPFAEAAGYSRVVRVGDHAYVAGTAPIMPDDANPPADPYGQTRRCLAIALDALAKAGVGAEHVVRTRIMLTRAEDFPEIARAHGDVFRDIRPVNTTYVVAALLDPRWLLEIELEAQVH